MVRKTPWFKSRCEIVRTILSAVALIFAVYATLKIVPIIVNLEESQSDEPSWHVLLDETSTEVYSSKFFIPLESSKIRVTWSEHLSYGNPNGEAYLCWERGYDNSACYMDYPIPIDAITEIPIDWLAEEKRLLFVEAGGFPLGNIKVHVEAWW